MPDHTSNKKGGEKQKERKVRQSNFHEKQQHSKPMDINYRNNKRDLYITSPIMTTMHFTNYMNDVHTKANNGTKSKKKNIEIKTGNTS